MRPTIGQLRKEQTMKTKILSKVVFAAMMAAGTLSQAQSQPCSNASLQGTYGFHGFATIVSPSGGPNTPRAIMGIFTMDGHGGATGAVTLDDNGVILFPPPYPNPLPPPTPSTYIVNADCTGTLFTLASGAGTSVMIVVVDGGKEFYQMRISPSNIILFGTTKKVSSSDNGGNQQCSNASLQGTYGFQAFATVVSPGSPGTPRALMGVFTLDGHGGWTANLTLDDNGTILSRPNEGGTYIVNADCTGTLFPTSGGSVMLVVVDGGREFYQMRLDPANIVVFGTTKLVSSGNNGGNQQ
jgi:hypothetical protein